MEHRDYDASGRIKRAVDGGAAHVALDALASDFAFAGREWDGDAGLYYNRARWLDADSGRFISEDPIGLAGGDQNLYRYAGGDPVNYRDPRGLWQEDPNRSAAQFPGIDGKSLNLNNSPSWSFSYNSLALGGSSIDVAGEIASSVAEANNQRAAEARNQLLSTVLISLSQDAERLSNQSLNDPSRQRPSDADLDKGDGSHFRQQ